MIAVHVKTGDRIAVVVDGVSLYIIEARSANLFVTPEPRSSVAVNGSILRLEPDEEKLALDAQRRFREWYKCNCQAKGKGAAVHAIGCPIHPDSKMVPVE